MKCPKCGYDNNKEDALYCGLCYELLKKAAKTEPSETPAAESEKGGPGTILQIALIAGILSGAGVYFYGASAPDSGQAAAALEDVRFREKTAAAESLLAAHNKGREELLAEIMKGEIDPEGFGLEGQYTKKLFKLEENYTDGINAVQLSCRKIAGETRDEACLKWNEEFLAREAAAMEDFNKKYQALIQRVAPR